MTGRDTPQSRRVGARIARLDWRAIDAEIAERGCATTPPLLRPRECASLIALWDEPDRFRSTVVMEHHRFGVGEYRYFADPLPPLVATLRERLYPNLAQIANRWNDALGSNETFPNSFRRFRAHCHRHGQKRPTPLILRYSADGYNCLHQDRYGEVAFPLQATILLSRPDEDFRGGEFLLVEQRPRMQSRGEAVALEQGEAIVFANADRPVQGARGPYRVKARHGVSRILSGTRFALGIIFHDAA